MFKKYTVLAAAMMLASTLTVSLAETAVRPPRSGNFIPTRQESCSPSWDCASTFGAFCGTTSDCFSTQKGSCATFANCDSTCGPICGGSSACGPTAAPQPTPTVQPTQKPSATQAPSSGDDYTTQSISAQEQKMLNLLNQDRKSNGLAALTIDPELCRIARIKSADMRDNGYFAHESPTYGRVGQMLQRFGYAYSAAGENIAHHADVDKAQAAFMSSSGHRANILSTAWTKVGIGIVTDRSGFIYATQIFVK